MIARVCHDHAQYLDVSLESVSVRAVPQPHPGLHVEAGHLLHDPVRVGLTLVISQQNQTNHKDNNEGDEDKQFLKIALKQPHHL